MRKLRSWLLAACGLPLALGGSLAPAQTAPASDAPASVPAVGAPVTLYPGTREYVWTLYVPVLTTERLAVVVRVPKEHVIGRRWDYEYPGLKSQRFKLGQVAEFDCKYSDWGLPQECRTEWHNVYADLPVLAMLRDHLDYNESEWAWEEQTMHIDVPHWSWKASTLTVSVPIFGPKDTDQAQAALDAQQAAAASAIDDGIGALDKDIAAVEARGADPHRLSDGGGGVDLPAMRQALRDEKRSELERIAAIRSALRELAVSAANDPPPADR